MGSLSQAWTWIVCHHSEAAIVRLLRESLQKEESRGGVGALT